MEFDFDFNFSTFKSSSILFWCVHGSTLNQFSLYNTWATYSCSITHSHVHIHTDYNCIGFSWPVQYIFTSFSLATSIQSTGNPLSSGRTFYKVHRTVNLVSNLFDTCQTIEINFIKQLPILHDMLSQCSFNIELFHLNWNFVANKWFPNCTTAFGWGGWLVGRSFGYLIIGLHLAVLQSVLRLKLMSCLIWFVLRCVELRYVAYPTGNVPVTKFENRPTYWFHAHKHKYDKHTVTKHSKIKSF